MKAMVLAAGLGRRLLPLTLSLPKPAVPVLGRPLAVQVLNRLATAGVEEAVLNLHHFPEQVQRLVGAGPQPGLPKVHFTPEPTILGTAGGIRAAAPHFRGTGRILVHNVDFLSDIDLQAALDAHRRGGKLATLVLASARRDYSSVAVDGEGNVLALAGRPEVPPGRVAGRHLFTGCHIIEEELLDLIPDRVPSGIVNDVYRDLAARGEVGSYYHDGFWSEFGTPELYLEGSLALLRLDDEARADVATHDPVREVAGGQAAVGPGVQLQDGARVEGRAALGFASALCRGSVLEDSVVMPEAWVGPGCRLRRVVIGPATEIPAGFECEDALVTTRRRTDEALPASVRCIGSLFVRSFSPPGPE